MARPGARQWSGVGPPATPERAQGLQVRPHSPGPADCEGGLSFKV